MQTRSTPAIFAFGYFCLANIAFAQQAEIPNPLINYSGFVEDAQEVESYRAKRRLTEDEFIEMAKHENTIVLDTRSERKFKELHLAGAVHLNFSDITKESLARVIPTKDTRVLIYCNNNFANAPKPFPTKMVRAALNIPTFISLYQYGYKNIYELGPVVDPVTSKLTFESVPTK